MPRKRKRRAPEVLDRVYSGGALYLEDAILSLLPNPPPPACRCGGAPCLGCGGRLHLVRNEDPSEYKDQLLKRTYCFVPPSAPAPPRVFHRVGWDQRKIVRQVMEESSSSNVLCSSYQEHSRFSCIGEALSTHVWDLLLERIGDHMMAYLLRFSSIFLPLTNKIYQQVTGPLLSEMLPGYSIKRQRTDYDGKLETSSYNGSIRPSCTDVPEKTSSCSAKGKPRKRKRLCSWQRRREHKKIISQSCFFCALETSDRDASEYQINRRQIFYNPFSSYPTFPPWHILNKLKPNNSGAALLMQHIYELSNEDFQSLVNHSGLCTNNSNCFYSHLLCLLKSLIRNAQHCDRKKLFLRHCPFPNFQQCSKDENENQVGEEKSYSAPRYEKNVVNLEQPSNARLTKTPQVSANLTSEIINQETPVLSDPKIDLAECYSNHQQVVSFIWAVIRSIIPSDLLGDCSNWRSLRSNISKFVGLQRFGKFNISQCLDGLESSQFPFLSHVWFSNCLCYKFWVGIGTCNCAKNGSNKSSKLKTNLHVQLFRRWIYWIFSSVIVPIISSCFYVTERQFEKLQVFYYPKLVWRKLTDNALICLEKQSYKLLDHASCSSIISERKFGYSKVRFLLKKNKVRIVANTKAPCKVQIHGPRSRSFFLKSVNSALKELHAVLRRIKHENPQALGSSVFGYDDVYQMLHRFLQKIKGGSRVFPKVYIVVGDVAKAFDTINQDKLVNILKDIVLNDKYILRGYTQVISTKKGTRTLHDQVAHGNDGCRSSDVIKNEAATRFRSSCCVIVDQGEKTCIKKEEMQYLLMEHLERNILKIGQRFYLQRTGICQGSSISTLLCSLYLGHLERSIILPYLEEASKQRNACFPNTLLLRWIDDFLFISTSEQNSASFFGRMQRGFKEYNCQMNTKKFGLNFNVGQNEHLQNRLYIGKDGVQFLPWSGLLINCETLEIQADYTRYLGIPINSTITVESNDSGLCSLKAKLRNYMRPKCHPLFYDSSINSSRTVRLNAYQAFLICAMKFHCYVRSISVNTQLNPGHLLETIEQSFRFMYKLIKKQMHKIVVSFSINPILELKKEEMVWLGLSAYIWVLKKKQTRHKDLLSLLKRKISAFGRMDDSDSDSLRYAVEDSHSSVFTDIQF